MFPNLKNANLRPFEETLETLAVKEIYAPLFVLEQNAKREITLACVTYVTF